MSERPKWQPPEKESEDPKIYVKREEKISCDKGSHAERSKANQPNHLKFWKKLKRKVKKKMMNKFMLFLFLMFLGLVFMLSFWGTLFVSAWMPAVEDLRNACSSCGILK